MQLILVMCLFGLDNLAAACHNLNGTSETNQLYNSLCQMIHKLSIFHFLRLYNGLTASIYRHDVGQIPTSPTTAISEQFLLLDLHLKNVCSYSQSPHADEPFSNLPQ